MPSVKTYVGALKLGVWQTQGTGSKGGVTLYACASCSLQALKHAVNGMGGKKQKGDKKADKKKKDSKADRKKDKKKKKASSSTSGTSAETEDDPEEVRDVLSTAAMFGLRLG